MQRTFVLCFKTKAVALVFELIYLEKEQLILFLGNAVHRFSIVLRNVVIEGVGLAAPGDGWLLP